MTTPSDQIWAYLHNELSAEERTHFEQALQTDPSLRKALEEFRATHQALTELGNDSLSDEQLTEQLMGEWAAEHPEYAKEPAQNPNRKILRFTLPAVAAAAAAVLLLTLPTGPIRWQRTLYGAAPQLRGESSAQPHYSHSELKQAAENLQDAVEARSNPSGKWLLGIALQELADGALSIEVSGVSRDRKNDGVKAQPSSKVWKKSFQSLESFRKNIPMFGKQIADEL